MASASTSIPVPDDALLERLSRKGVRIRLVDQSRRPDGESRSARPEAEAPTTRAFDLGQLVPKATQPEREAIQRKLVNALWSGTVAFEFWGEQLLATARPQMLGWEPPARGVAGSGVLAPASPSTIEYRHGRWLFHGFRAALEVTLHDPDFRERLVGSRLELTKCGSDGERELVTWLVGAGDLEAPGRTRSHAPESAWHPADWSVHVRSRHGRLIIERGRRGAQAPARCALPRTIETVSAHPDTPSMPLCDALARRTSAPDHQEPGHLTASDLATVLWHAMRSKPRRSAQDPVSRPYPSAGALHALEAFVVVSSVDGLARGLAPLRPGRLDLWPHQQRQCADAGSSRSGRSICPACRDATRTDRSGRRIPPRPPNVSGVRLCQPA